MVVVLRGVVQNCDTKCCTQSVACCLAFQEKEVVPQQNSPRHSMHHSPTWGGFKGQSIRYMERLVIAKD